MGRRTCDPYTPGYVQLTQTLHLHYSRGINDLSMYGITLMRDPMARPNRLDLDELLRSMPKRQMKRTTVDLPQDQIDVIDSCARALGLSRSGFLLIWNDSSAKAMVEWTQHLLDRSQIQVNFEEEETKDEQPEE